MREEAAARRDAMNNVGGIYYGSHFWSRQGHDRDAFSMKASAQGRHTFPKTDWYWHRSHFLEVFCRA